MSGRLHSLVRCNNTHLSTHPPIHRTPSTRPPVAHPRREKPRTLPDFPTRATAPATPADIHRRPCDNHERGPSLPCPWLTAVAHHHPSASTTPRRCATASATSRRNARPFPDWFSFPFTSPVAFDQHPSDLRPSHRPHLRLCASPLLCAFRSHPTLLKYRLTHGITS